MFHSCFVYLHFTPFILSSVLSTPFLQECQPGEEAKEVNGTIMCVKCPERYYSKDGVKCMECSRCFVGQKVETECLPYRNTHCQCPKGLYLDMESRACANCRLCHPGTYQISDCQHNRNRECRECERGTTTNTTNAKICDKFKPRKDETPKKHAKLNTTVIVLSVIGGGILLAGFVAALMCIRRKRERGRRRRDRTPPEPPIELAPFNREEARLLTQDNSEIPQLIDLNLRNLRPFNLNDLLSNDVNELSLILNTRSNNNWRTLAEHLNLSIHTIRHIENSNDTRSTSLELLLSYYATEVGATFAKLYNELTRMDYSACAFKLLKYVYVNDEESSSSSRQISSVTEV